MADEQNEAAEGSESDTNDLLCFFDWKQKALKLLINGRDKHWFYKLYGRYCNNVRNGKWVSTKILPCHFIGT